METNQQNLNLKVHFPQLDGIRFLAALSVLCGHWLIYQWLHSFNVFLGAAGVNLFFILSGFLITRILLVEKVVHQIHGFRLFKGFYIRRVLRIFPLYYLVIIIGLIIAIPGARETWDKLCLFILNVPNVKLEYWPAATYMHFWSLSAEEQFYLVFPFIMILTPVNKMKMVFGALFLLGILSRIGVYLLPFSLYHKQWASNNITLCCFDSLSAGSLLAWYYCFQPEKLKQFVTNKLFIISSTIVMLVFFFLKLRDEEAVLPNLFIRSAFSIVIFWVLGNLLLAKVPQPIETFLTNKRIVYLGKISYGIYVFHNFMPWLFTKLGIYKNFHLSIPFYFVCFGIVTVLLASISWKFFEKPINDLKKKFMYRGEVSV